MSYPQRSHSQAPGRRKDRQKRARWGADPGGEGAEIVDEALACSACAERVDQSRRLPSGIDDWEAHDTAGDAIDDDWAEAASA